MPTDTSGYPLSAAQSSVGALSRARRRTVTLLFLAIMIVAADKSVFAFAGPRIMDELHLSPTEFGMLGSAFFLLYSLSGIAFGLLTNRVQARWILLVLALIWASCQWGIAVGTSLGSLVFFRILLGIGAGPSTAVIQHACLQWYPPGKQVVPASAINSGLMAGILVSALCLPWLISHQGWRFAYLVLGIVSGLWALFWLLTGREGREAASTAGETRVAGLDEGTVPYRRLLLNRTFVGMTSLSFAGYLACGLGFSWNPTYMQKALGYSPMQVGVVVMMIMLFVIPTVLAISGLSQRWLQKGVRHSTAMVWLPVSCCALGGLCYLVMDVHSLPVTLKTLLLGIGFVLLNVQQSYGIAVCGGISTARQRGSVIAIHVALTTTAGVVAPLLAGYLVQLAGDDLGVGMSIAWGLSGCSRW